MAVPMLRGLLRTCWLPLAQRAAQAYVAGPDLEAALRVHRRLARRGFGSTLCYWNRNQDRPRAVAHAYRAALEALVGEGLDGALSVKAPALGFSGGLLEEVLERGRRAHVPVRFDSLGPEAADRVFSLLAAAARRYPALGCTLPGRWRRSLRDAERAIALGLDVRVVKGQWEETGGSGMEPRAGFLAVVDRLAGRARHVAVATHDPRLAHEAMERLRAAGTPCELELLLGLPARRALRIASEARVPVRIYIPYGCAWLPYRFSNAVRNPRVCWWFMRDLMARRPASWAGQVCPERRPAGKASGAS